MQKSDPSLRTRPVCFLFDNGSLRPEATFSLRETAGRLKEMIDARVEAVSLLHSSKIAPSELAGVAAQLLEPALTRFLENNPAAEAVLLPLFFGPSGALVNYLPPRLRKLGEKFPEARIRLARWLVDPCEGDTCIAAAMFREITRIIHERSLRRPKVILVDHGSPLKAVTDVRNHLGIQLRTLLLDQVESVAVASMEKREGAEYSFNDPLLSDLLATEAYGTGEIVVALQFLSPGRHAGSAGDIDAICGRALTGKSNLRIHISQTLAGSPEVIAVLAERFRSARPLA